MAARVRDTVYSDFSLDTRFTRQPDGYPPYIWEERFDVGGVYKYKKIADYPQPGFWAKKRCGEILPLNAVQIENILERRIIGRISDVRRNGNETISGTWYRFLGYLDPPAPNESLTAAAVIAAAANASSALFDALTFFAELRSTVGTLHGLFTRFFQNVMIMARRSSSFKDRYRAFQQMWLEARYGVRPIVYDVYNAQRALSQTFEKGFLVRGRGGVKDDDVREFDSGWYPLDSYTEARLQQRTEVSFSHYGWAAFRFDSETSARFQLNPLVTAWELIPYSFVVDWFINIGAWVSALSAQMTGDLIGPTQSLKQLTTQMFEYSGRGNGVTEVGSWGTCYGIKTTESYVRAPSSGIPLPPLNPRLNLPKLVDLVTLCIQGNGRVRRELATRR